MDCNAIVVVRVVYVNRVCLVRMGDVRPVFYRRTCGARIDACAESKRGDGGSLQAAHIPQACGIVICALARATADICQPRREQIGNLHTLASVVLRLDTVTV